MARAADRGARVLVGRCWEAGGAPAYWPWVQSMRGYANATDATDLAQIVPELRDEPVLEDPEAARFRLFDATAQFLRRAAESRPIVLVLDDLHAADASSLLLLQFVARELGSARLMVLGACRDVDPVPAPALAAMLAEVGREPVSRRLEIAGLSEAELQDYVAHEAAAPVSVAALHEQTGGNPLFAGEIVRLLSVEGRLAVPQSVRDVIARRLTHLSDACNRALVLASVLGREFTLDALARLSDVTEDALLDALDEAIAARIVSDIPSSPGRARFAHVLIRDTLYEGLSGARRVLLHRRVVAALEALHGDDPGPHLAELAHHAIAGRDDERAVRYASLAAERALASLADEEAARQYETALAALGDSDERARCRLLLSLGEAESRAGNGPAARAALLAAARVARRLGLAPELARAAAEYGGRIVYARASADPQLLPLLEEGLDALGEDESICGCACSRAWPERCATSRRRNRRDALSREAVELARRSENAAALAYALDGRAIAVVAPDTFEEVISIGRELRELAERNRRSRARRPRIHARVRAAARDRRRRRGEGRAGGRVAGRARAAAARAPLGRRRRGGDARALGRQARRGRGPRGGGAGHRRAGAGRHGDARLPDAPLHAERPARTSRGDRAGDRRARGPAPVAARVPLRPRAPACAAEPSRGSVARGAGPRAPVRPGMAVRHELPRRGGRAGGRRRRRRRAARAIGPLGGPQRRRPVRGDARLGCPLRRDPRGDRGAAGRGRARLRGRARDERAHGRAAVARPHAARLRAPARRARRRPCAGAGREPRRAGLRGLRRAPSRGFTPDLPPVNRAPRALPHWIAPGGPSQGESR